MLVTFPPFYVMEKLRNTWCGKEFRQPIKFLPGLATAVTIELRPPLLLR